MNSQIILEIFSFVALIYMFCNVEVLPFSSKKAKYITVYGTIAIVLVSILIFAVMKDAPVGQISLFAQTIPSTVLCWIVSKHKDLRFWFVFCSIDVIGFMLLLFSGCLSLMLRLDEVAATALTILIMLCFICIFFRYGKEFREIMDRVNKNWGILTLFVLVLYAYSYFFILYPEPMVRRPEYAPVVLGYAVVVLLSYVLIVKMVVGSGRIHDMKQEEIKIQLKLETQKRELEEEKSRMMIRQIQPHFIYNVLMSIRYFTKKDPQAAYDMIYDFSQYLRSNIECLIDNRYILWREELEHINAYVRIEEKRYKERLNVIYDVEDEEFYLPPLTVELLVENAIKHGVTQKIEGGTVWIRGGRTENGYQIMVEDDGVGFDVEVLDKKASIGLGYIKGQLDMMPGADMRIESRLGQGTKVWIDFAKIAGDEIDEDYDR